MTTTCPFEAAQDFQTKMPYHETGMRCPVCGSKTGVIDSRNLNAGRAIRRRRICPHGHRFTTHELVCEKNALNPS